MTIDQVLKRREKMIAKQRTENANAVKSGRAVLLSSRPANWEKYYRKGK